MGFESSKVKSAPQTQFFEEIDFSDASSLASRYQYFKSRRSEIKQTISRLEAGSKSYKHLYIEIL
jgi:hypothetical protein